MPEQTTYLTTRQLQELLQVDRLTIYRMLDAGEIPAFKIGRQWRFDSREIKRWLGEQSDTQNLVGEQAAPLSTSTQSEELPLPYLQRLQDSFAQTLGLSLVIVTNQAQLITQPSNEQAFGQILQTSSEGISYLAELRKGAWDRSGLEESQSCLGVLWHALQLGEQQQAMICCGPILYAEHKHALASELERIGAMTGFPSESLNEALLKTPALQPKERAQVARVLASFAVAVEVLVEQQHSFQQHLQKIVALALRPVVEC